MHSISRKLIPSKISVYFFFRFLSYFFVAIMLFVLIMIMASFMTIINEDGVMGGFSQYFLYKSLLWLLPSMVASAMPFSFVMAAMLSFSEFEYSGEMVAARAAGFSYEEILKASAVFAVFISILCLFLYHYLSPLGSSKSRDYVRAMFTKVTNISFSKHTFQKISDFSVYFEKISAFGALENVKLYKRENAGLSVLSISAPSGRLKTSDNGISVNLLDGNFSYFDSKKTDSFLEGSFSMYASFIPYESPYSHLRKPAIKELTSFEILNLDFSDYQYKFNGLKQIFFRNFMAISPIAFFFLAFSLSAFFKKRGKFLAFILSLLCIFAYYGLSVLSDWAVTKNENLFPWIMPLPFVTLLTAGILGWRKYLRSI